MKKDILLVGDQVQKLSTIHTLICKNFHGDVMSSKLWSLHDKLDTPHERLQIIEADIIKSHERYKRLIAPWNTSEFLFLSKEVLANFYVIMLKGESHLGSLNLRTINLFIDQDEENAYKMIMHGMNAAPV